MIANPLSVADLVSELGRRGICLPEIQRRYVWTRSQIAKLLDSLYRGFPAGSILLWDTQEPGQIRDMATNLGHGVDADFPPKIVLDGQQRITSLGQVFDKTTQKQDRVLFNVIDQVFEPYSPRNAADPRWIDVTQLLTGELSELDLIERLEEAGVFDHSDKEVKRHLYERLKQVAAIRGYKFPVEIVREDDLEVVTEVFIRVNSAGTRLREAELALARLAWRLPGSIIGPLDQMEDACADRGFGLDARFLMRSLISVATRQSRFRDLKAFWQRPAEDIQRAWKRTERGLRLALDFVEGNIGIPGSEMLPSHLTLIPLTVVFSERDSLTGVEERALRRWFLLANAFSRYAGPTETTLNQDLVVLGPKCEGIVGLLEQLLRDLRSEPNIRAQDLERAGINSPFLPLAYLSAIRRDAVDWFKGIKLRRESFAEDQQIEYHHIFPKKLLDARGVDRFLRDELANIAFLGQKANRRIRSRPPSEYLPDVAKHDRARLEAQLVPMDTALWEIERFEEFLVARRQILADAMNNILESQ